MSTILEIDIKLQPFKYDKVLNIEKIINELMPSVPKDLYNIRIIFGEHLCLRADVYGGNYVRICDNIAYLFSKYCTNYVSFYISIYRNEKDDPGERGYIYTKSFHGTNVWTLRFSWNEALITSADVELLKDNFSVLLQNADDGKIATHLNARGFRFVDYDRQEARFDEQKTVVEQQKVSKRERRTRSRNSGGLGIIIFCSFAVLGLLLVLLFKKRK